MKTKFASIRKIKHGHAPQKFRLPYTIIRYQNSWGKIKTKVEVLKNIARIWETTIPLVQPTTYDTTKSQTV